ncbi:putative acetyltransferase [Pseudovibrio axinellae]|uniref:Putative acetyltransferase n=1 Tax=Pseudovibrio axinellae TaxID=989403 RepID=A0A166AQQ3_9HYPH|nr:GNAT family N-acetyltransferase [Pseudovibrio axinellae]KZL21435.1 putative acetyltransferase [Pseudovibrio axinellae]SER05195.1 Acetyltransferase (GNAT) domain-containing protein [Pseudovibrio axinellae]
MEHSQSFLISADKSKLQRDVIYKFLSEKAYWRKDLEPNIFDKAIDNSMCFGVYAQTGEQVGFARIVTDKSTFAYLCDVFILPAYRGKGLGKQLMKAIEAYPGLVDLQHVMLSTEDAQELYRQFGFSEIKAPQNLMEYHKKHP